MKIVPYLLLIAAGALTLPPAQAQAQTPARPVRKPLPAPPSRQPVAWPGTVATVVRPAAAPPAAPPAARSAPREADRAAPAASLAPAVTSPAAGAEAGAFGVGTSALNLGIGLGSRYGYGAGFGGGSSSVSPALSVSFERSLMSLGPGVLGVGAFVGYQGASYDFGGGDKWKYTDLIVMVRGTFHYPVSRQFDAYGGLGLGVRRLSSSWSGPATSVYNLADGASATDATSGLFVGGRYFFTSAIGAFAELGYDQTYFKLGLTAKF